MKIFFYSRAHTHTSRETLDRCLEAFSGHGHTWLANDEYADAISGSLGYTISSRHRYSTLTAADVDDGSVMISVGGDGTFLEAVRMLGGLPMPIVGVNAGRMGFLAQISLGNIPQALDDICQGHYTIERRTMLSVEGDFGDFPPVFPCALNEFTIHRHTADMVEVATYSDGELLAVIRGDGVIASTPTGSTAYSLSAGGPILSPDCACLICSGIAPHNFSVRPLVLPDTSAITFEVHTRGRQAMASLDNASFIVGDGARFVVKKSEYAVFLMQIQNISFYDTLRDRTMWGLDKRDTVLLK